MWQLAFYYQKVKTTNPWNPEVAPLQQVVSNHFNTTTITGECTVEEFQEINKLEANKANVFVEYDGSVIKKFRDVILMDKVKTVIIRSVNCPSS